MTFLEWLHMEYHEPEPGDNYHERDLIAAWNQAVAECRLSVRKMIMEAKGPDLTEVFAALKSVYERGPQDD
jgi:hypothetical protein